MALINQLALPSIIIVPWLGAAFLLFIPEYENMLRKRFAFFTILISMALLSRNVFVLHKSRLLTLDLIAFSPSFISGSFQLRFDWIAAIGMSCILLVCFLLISSRLGDTHRDSRFFAKTLFALGLANACFLFNHPGFFFLLQLSLVQAFIVFHLLGTEPLRGSSALVAAIFFAFVDLFAFFAWSFSADLLYVLDPFYVTLIISMPALTRLLIPFLSPWARGFFAASSLDASILFVSFSFMLGATALARVASPNQFLATLAIVGAIFGAILSLSDESLPQFLIRLASIMASLAILQMHLQALLILASFILLFTMAMLVQRTLSESEDGLGQSHLFLIWFLCMCLALVSAGNLIPLESPAWLAVAIITAFSCARRILSPMTPQRRMLHFFSARLSGLALFNAWLCFGLTLLVWVGVHVLIYRGTVLS
jgi:hypothetical protein